MYSVIQNSLLLGSGTKEVSVHCRRDSCYCLWWAVAVACVLKSETGSHSLAPTVDQGGLTCVWAQWMCTWSWLQSAKHCCWPPQVKWLVVIISPAVHRHFLHMSIYIDCLVYTDAWWVAINSIIEVCNKLWYQGCDLKTI